MQGLTLERYNFRKERTRRKIRESYTDRPRLSVCRTLKHIYAQVIDDQAGKTLVAASTLSPDLKGKIKTGGNLPAAEAVGKLVAEKALQKGLKAVSLTAADMFITDASKLWRMPRAKPD